MNIPRVKFHPAISSDKSIEVIDLDDLYKRRNELDHNPEKPHRVGFHMLIYIQQGEGSHFLDFSHWPFESGSFIFINKNQINAFDLSNRPQGSAILFTDAFINQIQSNMHMPVLSPIYFNVDFSPVYKPDGLLQQSCERLLLEVEKETHQSAPSSLITMFLFSSLMLMLERERPDFSKQRLGKDKYDMLVRFVELLETKFMQTRRASDYAAKLKVTYKTLNSLCKIATGQTAKQLIDAYTILEIKRQLVLEKKPIQQLSYELGFDDASNFVKYFKKHTSLTPSHLQR